MNTTYKTAPEYIIAKDREIKNSIGKKGVIEARSKLKWLIDTHNKHVRNLMTNPPKDRLSDHYIAKALINLRLVKDSSGI